MNKPLVSVIMGVYNDEKYLAKAVESILSQTFTDFEFIICDDCSSDKSTEILKYYEKKDDRIVLIHNSNNLGLASSLNKCIEYSKGKYIARMDSDDISLKDRLMIQSNYLEQNPEIAVVGAHAFYIDNNGNRYKKSRLKKIITLEDAVKKNEMIHPTTMIRKSVLLIVNNYTVNNLTSRAEDYDLWCKILSKSFKIRNLSDFLLEYREDENGIRKRKYKYRMQEAKIKYYWNKKNKTVLKNMIYIIKPLLIGLLPKKIYLVLRKCV